MWAILLPSLVLGLFGYSLFCNILLSNGHLSSKNRLPVLETYRLPRPRLLEPLDFVRRTRVLAPL